MEIRWQDKRGVPAARKMRTHAKERASGKGAGYEIIMAQCKRLKLYIYIYTYIHTDRHICVRLQFGISFKDLF